eukprot:365703-Chlamydomonas_euryale.AAC.12
MRETERGCARRTAHLPGGVQGGNRWLHSPCTQNVHEFTRTNACMSARIQMRAFMQVGKVAVAAAVAATIATVAVAAAIAVTLLRLQLPWQLHRRGNCSDLATAVICRVCCDVATLTRGLRTPPSGCVDALPALSVHRLPTRARQQSAFHACHHKVSEKWLPVVAAKVRAARHHKIPGHVNACAQNVCLQVQLAESLFSSADVHGEGSQTHAHTHMHKS